MLLGPKLSSCSGWVFMNACAIDQDTHCLIMLFPLLHPLLLPARVAGACRMYMPRQKTATGSNSSQDSPPSSSVNFLLLLLLLCFLTPCRGLPLVNAKAKDSGWMRQQPRLPRSHHVPICQLLPVLLLLPYTL
jgi:hypothetical protein